MKNDKKVTNSCDGTCNGCEKNQETAPVNDSGCHIAREAIMEMTAAIEKEKADAAAHEKCIYNQADEFIADCKRAGKNPMDVVAYIAKREQLSISGREPEEESRRHTYSLLRAVVTKIVKSLIEDTAANIAEECDFDMHTIGDLVARALKNDGADEDGDDGDENDPEDSNSVQDKPRYRTIVLERYWRPVSYSI